MVIIPSQKVFF